MLQLTKKQVPYVFAVTMGAAIGLVMSFSMTLMNIGLSDKFWTAWAKSYLAGVIIGVPTALVVAPLITRYLQTITKRE